MKLRVLASVSGSALFSLRVYAPTDYLQSPAAEYRIAVIPAAARRIGLLIPEYQATVPVPSPVPGVLRVVAPVSCGVEYFISVEACRPAGCSPPLEDGPFWARECTSPPAPPPSPPSPPSPPPSPSRPMQGSKVEAPRTSRRHRLRRPRRRRRPRRHLSRPAPSSLRLPSTSPSAPAARVEASILPPTSRPQRARVDGSPRAPPPRRRCRRLPSSCGCLRPGSG